MNRIFDALAAIGVTLVVFGVGWLILYPPRYKRNEWVQTGRGKWRRNEPQ